MYNNLDRSQFLTLAGSWVSACAVTLLVLGVFIGKNATSDGASDASEFHIPVHGEVVRTSTSSLDIANLNADSIIAFKHVTESDNTLK